MRRLRTIATLGAITTAIILVAAQLVRPVQATQQTGITLMTVLSEWKYPGSNMPSGASMSDGGNPRLQSIKCRAILTTPDPIEKVIKFYSDKLETPVAQKTAAEAKDAGAKSVSSQDDSRERAVTLRVIVVNKADTSTTLVISRAEAEKETHIAWLHYMRLGDVR